MMLRRYALPGAVVTLALAALLLFGRGTNSEVTAHPGVTTPLQYFDAEVLICLGGTDPSDPGGGTLNIHENTLRGELACSGENKALDGTPPVSLSTVIPPGNRLAATLRWLDAGWVVKGSADDTNASEGTMPLGTVAGSVYTVLDIFCDGAFDVFAKAAGPTPADLKVRSVNWETSLDPSNKLEGYLNQSLPDSQVVGGVFDRVSRIRSDATMLILQAVEGAGGLTIILPSTTPNNFVTLAPSWMGGGTVTASVYAGSPASASSEGLDYCMDSPITSQSIMGSGAVGNPTAASGAGLYAQWTTMNQYPDIHEGASTVHMSTDCKAIGGSFPDADADCWPDSLDTNDADPDQDDDGLMDGLELAYGTDPNDADTDNDGRSDLEEMAGPVQYLTNPTVSDTDGDGVPDGGFKLDEDGDLIPDCPDIAADGTCDGPGNEMDLHGACTLNSDTSGDGSSHRVCAWEFVDDVITGNGFDGNDNCPSTPNGAAEAAIVGVGDQTNTDDPTLTANGDTYGDACDSDDDNDGMNDGAEASFYFVADSSTEDGLQPDCGNATANDDDNDGDIDEDWVDGADNDGDGEIDEDPPAGAATPLDRTDPDSDGDGFRDSPECALDTDPSDANSFPTPASVAATFSEFDGSDQDGLVPVIEIYARTVGVSTTLSGNSLDVDGDGLTGLDDPDSDGDGISDDCEWLFNGTHSMALDTDGDGDPDGLEVGVKGRVYEIGNGMGVSGRDDSIPATAAFQCYLDIDQDGLVGGGDSEPGASDTAGGGMDFTYDDNDDGNPASGCLAGTDGSDDGPSWDTDCDGVLDGVTAAGASATDTDGDGLKDYWEINKWGTCPDAVSITPFGLDCSTIVSARDTDGDGVGDCIEVFDFDGNNKAFFTSDGLSAVKASLLGPAFGRDGDFDVDGNNKVFFTSDGLNAVKASLLAAFCKDPGE